MEKNFKVRYEYNNENYDRCESFPRFKAAYERYLELHKDVGEGKTLKSVWITVTMEKVIDSYHGI